MQKKIRQEINNKTVDEVIGDKDIVEYVKKTFTQEEIEEGAKELITEKELFDLVQSFTVKEIAECYSISEEFVANWIKELKIQKYELTEELKQDYLILSYSAISKKHHISMVNVRNIYRAFDLRNIIKNVIPKDFENLYYSCDNKTLATYTGYSTKTVSEMARILGITKDSAPIPENLKDIYYHVSIKELCNEYKVAQSVIVGWAKKLKLTDKTKLNNFDGKPQNETIKPVENTIEDEFEDEFEDENSRLSLKTKNNQ